MSDDLFRVEGDYLICNRCNCANPVRYGSQHYTDCVLLEYKEARLLLLKQTLTWVLNDVQEWCEAVDEDASWDGWDKHWKDFYWRGGLEKARAALEENHV